MMNLKGKSALVTGAAKRLGRAIAIALGQAGCNVVVHHGHSPKEAAEVAAQIRAAGVDAWDIQADLADPAAIDRLFTQAGKVARRLDILVNNAGTTRDQLLITMREADWDDVLRTNLKSLFNCCKAVARPMVKRHYGRIINISSVSGIAGQGGQTNYAASKAGVIGFTKSLAKELGPRSITVNAVAPGFVTTDLIADLPEELKQRAIEATPLRRLGTPTEVAYAVAFLASDEAAFITGEVLTVDGGLVMQG